MPGPFLADLTPFLDPHRVVVLRGRPGKRDALLALADTIAADFTPEARRQFIKSLFDREEVASTACGCGVAIPHARVPGLAACRIALGLCREGLDMTGNDGQPVLVLAMLASREDNHPEHLRVLAALASQLRDANACTRLANAADADVAIAMMTTR